MCELTSRDTTTSIYVEQRETRSHPSMPSIIRATAMQRHLTTRLKYKHVQLLSPLLNTMKTHYRYVFQKNEGGCKSKKTKHQSTCSCRLDLSPIIKKTKFKNSFEIFPSKRIVCRNYSICLMCVCLNRAGQAFSPSITNSFFSRFTDQVRQRTFPRPTFQFFLYL